MGEPKTTDAEQAAYFRQLAAAKRQDAIEARELYERTPDGEKELAQHRWALYSAFLAEFRDFQARAKAAEARLGIGQRAGAFDELGGQAQGAR